MPIPIDELFFVIRTNPDPSGTAKIFGIYESHIRADENILEFNKDPATSGLYEVAVFGSGLAGPPGSGNTLDQAYDQGGAGAGRTITADTGAVQIDGSNQLAVDINQAGDFGCLELDKSSGGGGNVLNIVNAGFGDCIRVTTSAGGKGLVIIHNGFSAGAAITQNGSSIGLSVVKTHTGSSNCVFISNSGTGNGIEIDQNGAGVGLLIDQDGIATALKIEQATNSIGLDVDKTGTGAGACIDVFNNGLDPAIEVFQNNSLGVAISAVHAGNGRVLRLRKLGTGAGTALEVENDGISPGLFLNQDGNGRALNIDSEATSNPLINLLPITGNSRGDIAFGTARTADPTTPSEGDVWYNATSNNLLLFDGTSNVDLTAGGGGGNTLDAAYDQGGAGAGRIITADTGALQIDGSNQLAVDINQAGNFGCLELDKNGTGAGTVLQIDNAGTGISLNIDHTSNNHAAVITQSNDGTALFINKTGTGAGDAMRITNEGFFSALSITQNSSGIAQSIISNANNNVLQLQKAGVGGGNVIDIDNNGTGIGLLLNQDGNAVALNIDSEATSNPLIDLSPITGNSRGDIAFGTARTGDPSAPAEGDFWYHGTDEFIRYRDSAKNVSLTGIGRKSILVEDPTASEDLTMWFTEEAVTVRQVEAVLRGTSTPSVTISVMHNTDRNAAGNNVLTSATAITSTTTGDSPAIGGDVTIPADSFVWLETSAQSGTVDELNVTIKFTED